jgi:hypothetical protein
MRLAIFRLRLFVPAVGRLAGGKVLAVVFDFRGAAPFGVKGECFAFSKHFLSPWL